MTSRPVNVPAAMREAFSDRRIAAAWNMFAMADGSDQIAALGGFTRLIAKHGLTLADMSEAIAGNVLQPQQDASAFVWPEPAAKADASPFGAARGAQGHKSAFRSFKQGIEIPRLITGLVTYIDEGTSRTGRMLTINVETHSANHTTIYGPLVVFSPKTVELISTVRQSVLLTMRVRPAPRPEFSPAVEAAWAA